METWKRIGAATVTVVLAATLINAVSTNDVTTSNSAKEDADNPQITRIYAIKMPDTLSFAGEIMPKDDPEVLERMDRELLVNTYWQSNALLIIKRANKYFPIMEPILAKNGVPDDFKYLAVIESGLQNVVSSAGATGFWQFMEVTAKEYGLEVNSNVDERYNVKLATEAACQYLKKAKEKFGSWTLAAASYNAGSGGIDKQLKKQEVTDYYDLLLGSETGRYVFRILALKEIMKNPKAYGYTYTKDDLYKNIPSHEVMVDYAVEDFVAFAKEQGINYKILKVHNPWLRDNFLTNKTKKKYYIEIPDSGYYPTLK